MVWCTIESHLVDVWLKILHLWKAKTKQKTNLIE